MATDRQKAEDKVSRLEAEIETLKEKLVEKRQKQVKRMLWLWCTHSTLLFIIVIM